MSDSDYFEQAYESNSVSPRGITIPEEDITRVVSSLDESRHRGTRRITGSSDPVVGIAWFVSGGVVEYQTYGEAHRITILHETKRGLNRIMARYNLPAHK